MSVIERAIEIHYATFPRADTRDGLAHPFGAVDHETYCWRVSRDQWDELVSLRPELTVPSSDPIAADRLLGERIVIDDTLPPGSLILGPGQDARRDDCRGEAAGRGDGMTMADAIFEALRASMSEPGCGYIDFTWRPTDKDGDPRGAEDARALADDLAARMPAFDADHPDCGDRCACYQRGINDEWEATGD